MYKNGAIIFILLIGLSLADTFLYETGNIQMQENVKSEIIDLNVKFKKQFNHQPKIAYGIKQLDMEGRILDTEILNLTPNGFTLRLTTDNLDKISINWLATDNPIIHVEYIKSSEETFQLPLIDELKDSNNVNSFIVGFEFQEGQKKHLSQTVTQKQNTIEVKSDKVAYYKLCLILTNFDNVYAKNTMGLEANENHPWLLKNKDRSMIHERIDVPVDIVDFADLIAINGFQSESDHLRLAVQSKQKQDQIDLYYGTWSDSLLQEMNFAIFLVGNKKVQAFEQGCAYLYSECNFKGQEFKICGNLDDVKQKVEIKSIHIPKDGILTLYKQSGMEGKYVKYDRSQACLENMFLGQ